MGERRRLVDIQLQSKDSRNRHNNRIVNNVLESPPCSWPVPLWKRGFASTQSVTVRTSHGTFRRTPNSVERLVQDPRSEDLSPNCFEPFISGHIRIPCLETNGSLHLFDIPRWWSPETIYSIAQLSLGHPAPCPRYLAAVIITDWLARSSMVGFAP